MNALNSIYELYSGACDMFIRPQRVSYNNSMLGPKRFKFGETYYFREDLQLINQRELKLECSHYYKESLLDSFTVSDLPTYPIKQLKDICRRKHIDILDCIEKSDIINKIKNVLSNENNNHENNLIPSPCIIYLHGNCGSRMDSSDILKLCLLYGFSVFSVDLSGSGLSEGEYISLGYYEQDDVSTIVQYLKNSPIVSSIALWGRSMGASTSILYTSKQLGDISLLVLDSPFSDLYTLSREVVSQFNLNIPEWIISSSFPIVMKMIRRSVRLKANFDLYDVAPIEHIANCNIPAFFIHGNDDNFVSPKHSLSLFENYNDPFNRKEIILVKGDHNAPRPSDALNSISIFLHRYLLPHPDKLNYFKNPLQLYGNTQVTASLHCFYCKQIKGIDEHSEWPHNVVIGVGDDCIQFILPYNEIITHCYQFTDISHVFVKEDCILVMQIPGHVDLDPGIDHISGIVAFYSLEANEILTILEKKSNKQSFIIS